jgi:hypothetical protein
LQFGGSAWKETGKSTLMANAGEAWNGVSSTDGGMFGQLAITKATLAVASLPSKVSTASSTPWAGGIPLQKVDASLTKERGMYFPYGGFVTMFVGPVSTATSSATEAASADSVNMTIAGQWDFVAVCDYLPE